MIKMGGRQWERERHLEKRCDTFKYTGGCFPGDFQNNDIQQNHLSSFIQSKAFFPAGQKEKIFIVIMQMEVHHCTI